MTTWRFLLSHPSFKFMRAESNWRLDDILDQRAALFTLTAPTPPESYTTQQFNRRLDYSFLPLAMRAPIRAQAFVHSQRVRLGENYPGLRNYIRR